MKRDDEKYLSRKDIVRKEDSIIAKSDLKSTEKEIMSGKDICQDETKSESSDSAINTNDSGDGGLNDLAVRRREIKTGGTNQLEQLREIQQHDKKQEELLRLFQSPEGQCLIRNAMVQMVTPATNSDGSHQQGNTVLYQPINSVVIASMAQMLNPTTNSDGLHQQGNTGLNQSMNSIVNAPAEHEKLFPQDTYSILALNGPTVKNGWHWPRHKVLFFLYGLMPYIFQQSLLGLLLTHQYFRKSGEEIDHYFNKDGEEIGNSAEDNPRAAQVLYTAQVVSLLAFIVFPSSAQEDLIKSILLFPWCTTGAENFPIGCIKFSCALRGIQGYNALFVVFLLIMQSDNTLDIILNFTAVNFISDLDDTAFSIAKSGIFGPALQKETMRIANTKLPKCMYRESKHIWYISIMGCAAIQMISALIYLMVVETPSNFLIAITTCAAKAIGIIFLLLAMACSTCGVWHRLFRCGLPSADTQTEEVSDKNYIGNSERTEQTTATHQSLESIEWVPDI